MYSSILVAVDLDRPESSARAMPVAVMLARCFSARLTLCSVVTDAEAAIEAEWSAIAYREMLDLARLQLSELASDAGMAIDVEVGTSSICGGILDVAGRIGADLIVLAAHAPALKDYLWTAHSARVASRAACSVLMVRGEGEQTKQRAALNRSRPNALEPR